MWIRQLCIYSGNPLSPSPGTPHWLVWWMPFSQSGITLPQAHTVNFFMHRGIKKHRGWLQTFYVVLILDSLSVLLKGERVKASKLSFISTWNCWMVSKLSSHFTVKEVVYHCPLEGHLNMFSYLTLLSVEHHNLSVPFKTLISIWHCFGQGLARLGENYLVKVRERLWFKLTTDGWMDS